MTTTLSRATATITLGLLLAGAGCGGDGPRYEDRRPPVDAVVAENGGVQAKDVVDATELMARDLLASPQLNSSSNQWTIDLTKVENKTVDPGLNYEVFASRLKSLLSKMGNGRVTLIAQKDEFHGLQNELEQPANTYGQGGGGGAGMPAGVQPDYALSIKVDEMPNRATSYFYISATLVNLHTRVIAWVSPAYEFQATR